MLTKLKLAIGSSYLETIVAVRSRDSNRRYNARITAADEIGVAMSLM